MCQACKKPLSGGGVIAVYNANAELGPVGNYPVSASPDTNPCTSSDAYRINTDPDVATRQEMAQAQVQGAIWLLNRPTNIAFGAFHTGCNPYAEQSAYTFGPPLDMEHWAAWVLHLQEKTWMGRWDLMRMLAFWWTHKGKFPSGLL